MPISPSRFPATRTIALLLALTGGAGQAATAPLVLYTDLVSGPNTGGENDQGVYLSVFGTGFGSPAGLGAATRLLIDHVEVASYRFLGPSKGRPEIQQLTVQIGALGHPTPGTALPIEVVVDGVASNADLSFIVNPGRILFVDNVHGDDASAVIGDIRHPYRHVQTADLAAAAWGQVRAGDVMVMRGTGTAWTDLGYENYFLRFRDRSGSAPTGAAGSGAIALMGYPGEDVFIDAPANPGTSGGAISAINGLTYPGMGQWVTISDLRIASGRDDGVLNTEILGSHWRIVNNDLSAASAADTAKAAGITGNGFAETWLGNHIHDVACGPAGTSPLQNHGIYIDGDGSYEIAYNLIERITGGSGVQTYVNGGNGSNETNNLRLHHNRIHHTAKHGINLADNTRSGIVVWDNVVYDIALAGLRFNSTLLDGAEIFSNTFYRTNTAGNANYGSVTNDSAFANAPHAFAIRGNIFQPAAGTPYDSGARPGVTASDGIIANNLWFGGVDRSAALSPAVIDSHALLADPLFASTTAGLEDLRLRAGSPAIDAMTSADAAAIAAIVGDDHDALARPQGAGSDIGAYESTAAGSAPPLVISAVGAGMVTANGATITWTTSIAADTQVDYGATAAYGSTTALQAPLVTAHSQVLTGLSPGTTYHYRVRSRDAAGVLALSGDQVFSTSGAPVATPPAPGGDSGGSRHCGLGAAVAIMLLGLGLAWRRMGARWMEPR
jgi:hypothetical protein